MEPVTAACWESESLTLQVNHHHLLLVLDLAEVLRFLLLLSQLGGHLADPVLQQLFLLLGKITAWYEELFKFYFGTLTESQRKIVQNTPFF